jgi:class 3 adenylate cyclase
LELPHSEQAASHRRIEALTKDLDAPLLISAAVHAELDGELGKRNWKCWADQLLKGKSTPIDVYALEQGPRLATAGSR